jgi:hypothetical protein
VYHLVSGTPVSSYLAGTQKSMAPMLLVHGGQAVLAGATGGGSHLYDSATGLEIQHLLPVSDHSHALDVKCASARSFGLRTPCTY